MGKRFRIDPSRCAEELFTFAPSFSKFNHSLFIFPKERKEDFHDIDGSDSEEEYYDENDNDDSDHNEESDEDTCCILITTGVMHIPHFVKCTPLRLQFLSVLPLLSGHSQNLRELKLEFDQLCCKDD